MKRLLLVVVSTLELISCHSNAGTLDNVISVSKVLLASAVQVKTVPPGQYATGVLVKIPADEARVFFVSNKHVFEAAKKLKLMVPSVDKSQNTIGTMELDIELFDNKNNPRFYLPSNAGVDIAIIPIRRDAFGVSHQAYFTSLTVDMFADDTVVFAGQPVCFCGYPLELTVNRSTSLLRTGTIAGVDTLKHLILLNADAFGGSSGSPVFIDLFASINGDYIRKHGVLKLFVGIIQGYVQVRSPLARTGSDNQVLTQSENSGIAVVVPASQLRVLVVEAAKRLPESDKSGVSPLIEQPKSK